MNALLRVGLHEVMTAEWSAPFAKTTSRDSDGEISGVIHLTMLGEAADVIVSLPIAPLTAWVVTPDATMGGAALNITASGMVDGWSEFDLGSLFGTGSGPFTYALWFEAGGTVSFDRDITLSYQGAQTLSVSAGEVIAVDETLSEYALTLDDGNSVIIIYEPSPGNFAMLPPTLSIDTFPGSITR
ncbi:MAG: hypothetical protein LBH17_06600 [Oscillospiraceae bacterium]|jgi:hypothetical protein|nr:hypothetical protein [Oscillospiraceae bacterium]